MNFNYTLSTLITDAPNSANIIPQKGPGARPANSKTFTPFKGIFRGNSRICCMF